MSRIGVRGMKQNWAVLALELQRQHSYVALKVHCPRPFTAAAFKYLLSFSPMLLPIHFASFFLFFFSPVRTTYSISMILSAISSRSCAHLLQQVFSQGHSHIVSETHVSPFFPNTPTMNLIFFSLFSKNSSGKSIQLWLLLLSSADLSCGLAFCIQSSSTLSKTKDVTHLDFSSPFLLYLPLFP